MVRPLVFVDPRAGEHRTGPGHPERPNRIAACLDALAGADLEVDFAEPPGEAAREDLIRVHDERYLDRLERFSRLGGGQLDPDTAAGPASFEIAARASAAGCEAVRAAYEDRPRSFCLVRPPGHHATPGQAMGFCLLNHAAVAARYAQALGKADRVAVVDFDVHHGNGTEEIFWDDPSVLYLSLHQYPWYPGTGALEADGGEAAKGTTVNVPLPAGAGDAVYLAATARLALPVVRAFAPDLLIVSAGYDAHVRDPLGLMEVTTEGFGLMTSMLVGLAEDVCEGRIVMTLEGGYDLDGLSSSLVASLRSLGRAAARPDPDVPAEGDLAPDAAAAAYRRAAEFHGPRWGFA